MITTMTLIGWLVAGWAPPANPEGATPTDPPTETGEPSTDAPTIPPTEASEPAVGEDVPANAADAAPPAEPVADDPEPAPLPPKGPPPPQPSEPRAWGGAFQAPLPQPPAKADPSTLGSQPWRGRVWLGVGLSASIPLAGRPPAAGGVVSVVGELGLGWRVNRYLGLLTAISSFGHDAGQRTVTASDGTAFQEVEVGRITAFDLVTARVFAPAHRRIEPWAEVGAGVGVRRGPFAVERQAVGLVRVGAGVDFWLAPTLTLGASTAYRVVILGEDVGQGLRVGADLGLHW